MVIMWRERERERVSEKEEEEEEEGGFTHFIFLLNCSAAV